MAEKVASMYIDFETDIADVRSTLGEIKAELKGMGEETGRSTGKWVTLGNILSTSIVLGMRDVAGFMIDLTKGLIDFASNSPDVQIAMVGMNEQLRVMSEELGPEAGKVVESFTELLKDIWPDVKPALEALLKFISDDLIPAIGKAWDMLFNPPKAEESGVYSGGAGYNVHGTLGTKVPMVDTGERILVDEETVILDNPNVPKSQQGLVDYIRGLSGINNYTEANPLPVRIIGGSI